jgi:hypothetical protein
MRKRIRVLIFAVIAAAVIVPVGFALSLESSDHAVAAAHGVAPIAQTLSTRSPIIATTNAAVLAWPQVPEGAKLFAVGTVLFGLAAAMRRTS